VGIPRFGKKGDDQPDEPRPPGMDLAEAIAREREAFAESLMQRGASHKEYERRLQAQMRHASADELAGAASELSSVLGAAPVSDARAAALERLSELHASGAISEEQFTREKQRILGYG
jgi:Short C-terminal domain